MKETILKSFKSENKLFIEKLNNINIVNLDLINYLKESLKSDNEYLKGWEYLKNNLTEELKEILKTDTKYWELSYNDQKKEYLLNQFYTTEEINKIKPDVIKDHRGEGILSQLGSFVYVWNGIKSECNKKEQEQNLKIDLEQQGFKEIKFIIDLDNETREQANERRNKYYKQFDGLKVLCVLDVNAIGLLGSFDTKTAKEGKLTYSEYQNALMLIPKRCRTRGHIITSRCFIKEV